MSERPPDIALYYDESGFVEPARSGVRNADGSMGLMGRQVAGAEFLDAYLSHGDWDALAALVRDGRQRESLTALCRDHPSSRDKRRRLTIHEESEFHARFFPTPPAEVLYSPSPPEARYAWARQHAGPGAFALCGVTHTLSSVQAVGALTALVNAPFESFDALICTSEAVRVMVRAVTDNYCAYLADRHGGKPVVRAQLPVIPLGVNEGKFRPPTAPERAAARKLAGVADDEVCVLCVGRLSHHSKAHPSPLFRGLSRAARSTGVKVHLVLAGWAAVPAVKQAYLDGARVLAPNVRTTFVDGTDPAIRNRVWHAADVFASLPDNIQETFGLVILEAMASGLPVVATDWDGYRDLVVPGETGLAARTALVPGATTSATSRLLTGEINYDRFLAECSQATVVGVGSAADAFGRLLGDPALRRKFGEAGRRRVLERFTWAGVVKAYERLWAEQRAARAEWVKVNAALPAFATPAAYPAPEYTFAGYPTTTVADASRLRAVPHARPEIEALCRMPLTCHVAEARCADVATLRAVYDKAAEGCSLGDVVAVLASKGVAERPARATAAWMVKHGLLELEGG